MTHSQYLSKTHFPALDGVRGFAAVWVIAAHTWEGSIYLPMTKVLLFCVDIFFVLSAYLITTQILRERRTTGHVGLRNFYIRRAMRILPVYSLFLLCAAVWAVTFASSFWRTHILGAMPYLLTFTANWKKFFGLVGPPWTLSIEEQFYLFWPAAEFLLPRKRRLLLLAGLAAVNIFWSQYSATHWHPGMTYMTRITFFPIVVGVALAYCMDSPRGFALARRLFAFSSRAPWYPVLFALGWWNCGPADCGFPRLFMDLLLGASICAVVFREFAGPVPFFGARSLRRIGTVSYAMYLFHQFVVLAITPRLQRLGIPLHTWPVLFLVVAPISYGIGELSFRFVERPFARWKKKYSPPETNEVPRLAA